MISLRAVPLVAFAFVVASTLSCGCHAFVSPSSRIQQDGRISTRSRATTAINSGLFGGLFGGGGGNKDGSKTVIDLPAKDVKIGALRFLLNIHLVGEQNNPTPKSWLCRQGDDGNLQVYYQDATAMLSIQLQEYGIKMVRYGEKPSLQYQLQESVLLHNLLDALQTVALDVADDNIAEEQRLLQLKDDTAIAKARETLPVRKEE
jgi:hypothetical protein